MELRMENGDTKMAEKHLALRSLPSAKSPLGRHNNSDGGVSPSENKVEKVEKVQRVEIQKWLKNTQPYALCPLPKALQGDTIIAMVA